MGETKKAIREEVKSAFQDVLKEINEEESKLTKEEKTELREYIERLSEGTNSSFNYIFIRKKIKEIVGKRESIRDILN